VVALKQRFTGEKKFLCWQTPDSFFGLRHLKKGDNIYIVEGEMDVLALAEVGVRAVSVPNGAPMKVTEGKIDPSEDGKFKFLWDAKEYIDAAERVLIATDHDGPGEALAEEIAR
jgi:twinkle protein